MAWTIAAIGNSFQQRKYWLFGMLSLSILSAICGCKTASNRSKAPAAADDNAVTEGDALDLSGTELARTKSCKPFVWGGMSAQFDLECVGSPSKKEARIVKRLTRKQQREELQAHLKGLSQTKTQIKVTNLINESMTAASAAGRALALTQLGRQFSVLTQPEIMNAFVYAMNDASETVRQKAVVVFGDQLRRYPSSRACAAVNCSGPLVDDECRAATVACFGEPLLSVQAGM